MTWSMGIFLHAVRIEWISPGLPFFGNFGQVKFFHCFICEKFFHFYNSKKKKMKRNIIKRSISSSSLNQNEIQSLQQEVYQLKDLECDLYKLNDEIAIIEAKYNMVLDEKDRTEVLQKAKLNVSKQNAKEMHMEIQVLKTQISQAVVEIDNLTRDNDMVQKSCENKENQILNLTVAIKEIERVNENKTMDLQATEEALIRIKEQKVKMEEECDKLCKRLNENKDSFKELEKDTKNQIIVEQSLKSTLENLKEEGESLLSEMKMRENVLKETSTQYQNFCQQVKEANEENEKLNKQFKNAQDNYNRLAKNLEQSQRSTQQKSEKLKQIEIFVTRGEEELSKSVIKRDNLMKEHSELASKNKDLNLEIDDCLMKILQLENINKALQKHIEEYISCDEEARILLDRKQKMIDLLKTVGTKISTTQSVIAHLM